MRLPPTDQPAHRPATSRVLGWPALAFLALAILVGIIVAARVLARSS